MRKILFSISLFIALVAVIATTSKAATNADLIEYATSNHTICGVSTGVDAGSRVKAKRYLTENPVTDSQADFIIANGNELIALMEKAGVSDPSKLSKADKEKFMSIAREAAASIGLTLVFHPNSVDIYKDGVFIDNATLGTKLVYTGNNINIALIISLVAVSALSLGFIARKKLAYA